MKIIVIAAQPEGVMFAVEAKYDVEFMMVTLETCCKSAPATQKNIRASQCKHDLQDKTHSKVYISWLNGSVKSKHTWLVDFASHFHGNPKTELSQRITELVFLFHFCGGNEAWPSFVWPAFSDFLISSFMVY